VTNADGDRSGRLGGMRGENRSTGACGYTWERRVSTVMSAAERVDITLGCSVEEVERVAGVDEPDGCLYHGCRDWW
jgi:hypothetical protein